MQGDVIGAEGMPEYVAVLSQASLLEGRLLLPIVDRPADIPVVAHVVGRLDPCPDGLGQSLQDLPLARLMLSRREYDGLLLGIDLFPGDAVSAAEAQAGEGLQGHVDGNPGALGRLEELNGILDGDNVNLADLDLETLDGHAGVLEDPAFGDTPA